MKLFRNLLLATAAVSVVTPVFSQTYSNLNKKNNNSLLIANSNTDTDTLKITVTGTRNPRPVDTFPGSVDVFNRDELDEKTGFTLRDLTDQIPGVTTESQKRTGVKGTPNGGNNMNIRGLERNRVLFLIDGIRLPTYYYGDSGSAPYYNMNQGDYVDFGTLKNIEILKGPASALYGADALGGVVSYKSLKARDLLKPGDEFKIFSQSSYDTSNFGITQTVQLAAKLSDTFSSLAVVTIEDSKATQVNAEKRFIDDQVSTGRNYYLSLTKDFDDYSYLDLVYEQVNRDSETKASQATLDAMEADYYIPSTTFVYNKHHSFMKTNRDRISLEYNYDNPDNEKIFKSINSKLYSQYTRKDDDLTRDTAVKYSPFFSSQQGESIRKYYLKNDIYGIDLALTSTSDFANTEHLLTYGIDYNITDTTRLRDTDGTLAKDTPDTQITRSGLYIQDEFSYGKFDFIAGLRFDDYELDAKTDSVYTSTTFAADLSEDSFSPKFAATYNFSNNLSGFAQYAQGFRAPAWYEVNSAFSNPARGYTTESNPNLKPETSDTYEVGFRARYPKFDLNAFGFFSKYDNFIEQLKIVNDSLPNTTGIGEASYPTLNLYKSVNADKAEIKGIELSGEYFFESSRSGFSLFSLIAFQEGTNTTEKVPLKTISPFEARLGIKYKSSDNKFKAELSNKFVGSPRVKTDESDFIPEEYSVAELTTAYVPNDRFELNAGIYNLFDATYYNYQDVRSKSATLSNITAYTQPGRYFQVGFGLKF